jgi:DNA mismatch repair protein MutS
VVFLHKIKEGAADKSYGIHVAQLANLPNSLIKRANELLENFENQGESVQAPKLESGQLSFFDEPVIKEASPFSAKEKKALEQIREIDILEMTPMQAMNTLYELHKKLKS